MKAIEFETTIRHGLIKIPSYFKNMGNTKAKVIILVDEVSEAGNYDQDLLLKILGKANNKGLFNEIGDSLNWQQQQRDEWE